MRPTRRRVLAAGTATLAASIAGCSGGTGADPESEPGDSNSEPEETDTETADPESEDGWPWDGDIPIESVTQYHEPSCECCGEYVAYLERNGFDVTVETRPDVDALNATKTDLGVPESMWSCHTIEFGEYLVEGHVPLEAVETLFERDASVHGISIPGMPFHAPGMGLPGPEPLLVYAFEADGSTEEFIQVG